MLGVTRLPPWVEQVLATFEPLFSDSRNVTSFVAFVSAVIMVEAQYTVSELARGISRPDEDAKSGRAYRYFLGEANWSVTDLAQYHANYAFDQLQGGTGDCWASVELETIHQETNEKFGFKQYELRGKQGIERYIQPVFLAWTLVTLTEQTDVGFWEDGGGLSLRLDHMKENFLDSDPSWLPSVIEPANFLDPKTEMRCLVDEALHSIREDIIMELFSPMILAVTIETGTRLSQLLPVVATEPILYYFDKERRNGRIECFSRRY